MSLPGGPRWRRYSTLAFQVLLLAATLLALAFGDTLPTAQRLWLIALVLSTLIWHWLSVVEAQDGGAGKPANPVIAAVSLGVLTPLCYLMVQIHSAYFLLFPALIGQAFTTMPVRWAVVATLILTLLAVWSLAG